MGGALAGGKLTPEPAARASLVSDGGAAASSEEFFRCPAFLRAEGVTHSLLVEGPEGNLVAPLIVREIEGTERLDAVSPYGYPGVVARESQEAPAALDLASIDWSDTGIVSAFVRATAVGPQALAGVERGRLQVSDPELERKSRMSDRQQVRRNEAEGYELALRPGPDSSAEERAGFRRAYEETMDRSGASRRYYFDREWFDEVLSSPRTWLALLRAPGGGDAAAASIAALSDGVLHYFLSGTADEHLRQAPMKNLIVGLQDLSDELAVPLNLGGGLSPGDGLEEFKRGFANTDVPFLTHEIVCDVEAYERLSAGRASGDFFPAYRAPRI